MRAESITKEEMEFWNEWYTEDSTVIKDGVVCAEKYVSNEATPRLLFLLKEVNGGAGWDLREFLKNGGRTQTWDNVTRWIEGIRRIDEEIEWSELEENSENRRSKYLKEICVVNIKKTSGSHTSVKGEIADAASSNADKLRRQISIYEPDIIICGGTGDYYYDNLVEDINQKPKWERTKRGIYYIVENKRVIISYLHPEARVKDCVIYYGLIDAIKELKREGII